MGVSYLLKLVYYLKTELCGFGVFNNQVLNLFKKGKISFFVLLTELNNLFRNSNKFILVYLYYRIVLSFYSFVLYLNIVNLLTISFIY